MSYGMFTDEGERLVGLIAKTATTEEKAIEALNELAETKGFEEATDTAVREAVIGTMRATRKKGA